MWKDGKRAKKNCFMDLARDLESRAVDAIQAKDATIADLESQIAEHDEKVKELQAAVAKAEAETGELHDAVVKRQQTRWIKAHVRYTVDRNADLADEQVEDYRNDINTTNQKLSHERSLLAECKSGQASKLNNILPVCKAPNIGYEHLPLGNKKKYNIRCSERNNTFAACFDMNFLQYTCYKIISVFANKMLIHQNGMTHFKTLNNLTPV